MSQETTCTIGELARQAGVTARTIRYYTAEGLLPAPDSSGQYALYNQDHLLRLRLIARLKQAYLPLGEIKARIADLASEQISQLLAEYEQAGTAALSSAADYLAHVLKERPGGSPTIAESRAQYEPAPALDSGLPAPAMSSPDQLRAPLAPAAPLYGLAVPAALAARAPSAPERMGPRPNRLLQKLGLRAQPTELQDQTAPLAGEERWRRIVLAPGVELHLREPLAAGLAERVARLIEQARSLLNDT